MNATIKNRIARLGEYLIGQNIDIENGRGMVFNPEHFGRNLLAVFAMSLPDAYARRVANEIFRDM